MNWKERYHALCYVVIVATLALVVFLCFRAEGSEADTWKITAYCGCPKCCGQYSDGYFASGKKVYVGGIACNWLSFGTKVYIDGMGVYTVEDRGAKSLFGDKNNHIKHIDVYFEDHEDAKRFGVKYRKVIIK